MTITDVDPNDMNIILGQIEDDALNELRVDEDYNELFWIPYPSHDGFGIVNERLEYFDKVVDYTVEDLDGPWMFDFRVHNSTPWPWSDYHFEFWTADFTERLLDVPLLEWSNDIFTNWSWDGSTLAWWAPDWQYFCQTNQFLLLVDMPALDAQLGGAGSFGIRQVATTVPEPLTVTAGLLSVASLVGYLRKRRA